MTTLRIRGLTVAYGQGDSAVRAIDDVDLNIEAGQIVGIVGESGSGKSTLARATVGLAPAVSGRIFVGEEDVLAPRAWGWHPPRRQRVQMVFQDPLASLNPRMTVGASIGEALANSSRETRRQGVAEALEMVSLEARHAAMYPRELSGGQRQRVAIARALAAKPDVLVADEITSALDASVQGSILNLVRRLQRDLNLTIMFISHNLAVVRYVSDAIAVMNMGRVVEFASTEQLTDDPQHPYTRTLLASLPGLEPPEDSMARDLPLELDLATTTAVGTGCSFRHRCPDGPARLPERNICVSEDPRIRSLARRHQAACHFVELEDTLVPGEQVESSGRAN